MLAATVFLLLSFGAHMAADVDDHRNRVSDANAAPNEAQGDETI